MKELLKKHIVEKLGRTPERLDIVIDSFEEVQTKKKEVLLEVGQICNHVYFIAEGCLKIGTYNLNGEESTTNIAFEGEWRTSMSSFVNQQASNERIVSVEASHLLVIGRDRFLRLSQEIPEFEHIYKGLLEESYSKSIERVQSLMAMDALDRLKWLLSQ
ncbi:MAG: Crp/Fnr family transcriptional regulator, partial [Bacteroidota bacterium]